MIFTCILSFNQSKHLKTQIMLLHPSSGFKKKKRKKKDLPEISQYVMGKLNLEGFFFLLTNS